MTEPLNRRVVLASRPEGEPTPANFRLETAPVPQPGPGQVLLRTIWLSLDPYMRGRMSAARSYARPVEIGQVMEGGTVSEVVASRHPEDPQRRRDRRPGRVELAEALALRQYIILPSGIAHHDVADL